MLSQLIPLKKYNTILKTKYFKHKKPTKRTYLGNSCDTQTYYVPKRLITRSVKEFKRQYDTDTYSKLPSHFSKIEYKDKIEELIKSFDTVYDDTVADIIIKEVKLPGTPNNCKELNLLFLCWTLTHMYTMKVNDKEFEKIIKQNDNKPHLRVSWRYVDTVEVYNFKAIFDTNTFPKMVLCGSFPEYKY